MSKRSVALTLLPPAAARALQALGENLAVARLRRGESQRVWARRLGCSVPTLIRLERGDPGVGAGLYATALWLIGRADALPESAAPSQDRGALEDEVRAALRRRGRARRAGELRSVQERPPLVPRSGR
jgi:transcriptional regulator with XRE-family HTH domain